MIHFTTKDDQLVVSVSFGKSVGNFSQSFSLTLPHSVDAKLYQQHFEQEMERRIKALREQSYLQGWRDAKAHKGGKQSWFYGGW